MLTKVLLTLTLALSIQLIGFSQEKLSSKVWAFSMEQPKAWLSLTKSEKQEHVQNLDLSEQALKLIKDSDTGFVTIAGYAKYDPNEREGLIPTIQIQARRMSPASFEVFKQQIVKSREGLKKVFDNFELLEDSEVIVSGHRTFRSVFSFTVATKDGQSLKARTTTYLIPRGNYFLQLTFNDGTEGANDCSAEFKALVRTIAITR